MLRKPLYLLLTGLLVWSTAVDAKIDLVTLPARDKTQLTIYNSADLTLVREQRTLILKKGLNRLEFGWENTLIDPTSVQLYAPRNESMARAGRDSPYNRLGPPHRFPVPRNHLAVRKRMIGTRVVGENMAKAAAS